jgi:hypothetical protein
MGVISLCTQLIYTQNNKFMDLFLKCISLKFQIIHPGIHYAGPI